MSRLVHVANAVTVFTGLGFTVAASFSLAWLLVEWAGGPSSLIFGSIVGGLVFGAFAGLIHDPPNRHRNDDTRTEATGPGVWPVA